jgi:ACS family hexuronate transporter-like MFS transporter
MTNSGRLGTWWPVFVMMLCSLLSYVDRQTLAVLSPVILADTGLTAYQYSQIISAFSIAYMIGNPIWGSILDRIGLRIGMTLAVGIWSIACGLHAVVAGAVGFGLARVVLGFGEGATFPGGLRTAMESLEPHQQSRGIAISYSGGSLGALLTPLLVTPIAAIWGWRAAFLVTATAGGAWLVVWLSTWRSKATVTSPQWAVPNIFERRFWSLVTSYGISALPLSVVLYMAPLYLNRRLGFSQTGLGKVLWIPPLGWEVGYFVWGWFNDRFTRDNPGPPWVMLMLSILALPGVLITAFSSAGIVLVLMFWEMFVAVGFVVVSLRAAAAIYPQEQTAMVAGIGAGSWSAFVALLLPLIGRLFDAKDYTSAFVITALLPALGASLWWLTTWRTHSCVLRRDSSRRGRQ